MDAPLSHGPQDLTRLRDAPETVLRRRILTKTSVAVAFLSVTGIVVRHVNTPIKLPQLIVALFLASLPLLTPVLIRRLTHTWIAALPTCITVLLLTAGGAWKHGGLHAPITAALPILPIFGFFFGGHRLGMTMLLGAFAVTGGSHLAGSLGFLDDVDIDPSDDRNRAIVLFFLSLTTFVIGAIYERSRRFAEAHLIESSRLISLGTMAGGIAHEINNPLTIVIGYSRKLAGLAKQSTLDHEVIMTIAERLMSSSSRIAAIVAGLLTYSRNYEREPRGLTSIGQILEDTLVLCGERFRTADIDLRIGNVPRDLTIMARSAQISQVFLNLLDNAFDAAAKSKERWVEIKVDIDMPRKTYNILIIDSGKGVPPALRAKIFTPFFTTKDVGNGVGLGLSLCASIMSEHGGEVFLAENVPWTTFVVRFPAALAAPLSVA